MSLYFNDKFFTVNHSTSENLKQTIQKFVQSLRKFCMSYSRIAEFGVASYFTQWKCSP